MPTRMLTPVPGWTVEREEIAWAAGFFDGEGTIAAYHRAGPNTAAKPCIRIAQVDPRPLVRFRLAVGRGVIGGPTVPRNPNASPYYVYTVSNFEEVQAVMAILWTFLSAPKRTDAAIALRVMTAWFERLKVLCRRKRHVLAEVGLTSMGSCAACAAIGRRNGGGRPLTRNERDVLSGLGEPLIMPAAYGAARA